MGFFRKRRGEPPAPVADGETYTVVVHSEDDGYWAEVPELPGCATQGKTVDELLLNVVDAIQGCLAIHFEDEGPHPRHKVFTMNVPVSYPGEEKVFGRA